MSVTCADEIVAVARRESAIRSAGVFIVEVMEIQFSNLDAKSIIHFSVITLA
jgi:hypothetical protein